MAACILAQAQAVGLQLLGTCKGQQEMPQQQQQRQQAVAHTAMEGE